VVADVPGALGGSGGAAAIRDDEQPVEAAAIINSANPEAQAFVVRTRPG
jgi:hypothetical protein